MKTPRLLIAALAACAMTIGSGAGARDSGPVVNAPAGSVEGLREGNAEIFRAIPYALPPLAARR